MFSYRIAQAAVLEALPKLHELEIPTKRPTDFFAEMIKSDAHMAKVSHYSHLFSYHFLSL